jgi:hypothetical protein
MKAPRRRTGTPPADPIFALIKGHKASLSQGAGVPDEEFNRLVAIEEKKLQKLARTEPKTLAGARALLIHVARTEACYINGESPIGRAMFTVAKALRKMEQNR